MESNKDMIINLSWILCDMNLRGLKVLKSLRTFKNCKDELV